MEPSLTVEQRQHARVARNAESINESLTLNDGIPLERDYQGLTQSESFLHMEAFSNDFLVRNEEALRAYAEQWVADPLHQWSRQWEYPFVHDRIKQVASNVDFRVLDAGSGATFFPYFLTKQHSQVHVDCCDYDKSLQWIYEQFNRAENVEVSFSVADLRDLPFEDQSIDVVYCISVLEHTNAYDTIVNEFFRVLRPGGKLIVTFDISRDGRSDIPEEKAEELLSLLVDRGDGGQTRYPGIRAELGKPSVVTTGSFIDVSAHLLPWRKPGPIAHLKSLIKSGRPKAWPADLTFYCLDVDKPVT